MDPLLSACVLAVSVMALFGVHALFFQRNRQSYAVREVKNLLTSGECDHIIGLAGPLVRRSVIVHKGENRSDSALRTSTSAFFTDSRDSTILRVKRRIAELSETDLRCQEPLQVTHYNATEFYAPHRDALGPGGIDVGEAGDRYCTVIIYLNDDYSGGCTCFHKIAKRVKPERGKAALFYNLTEDGEGAHPFSLHSAEPVVAGEKWLINQWIRQRPFGDEKICRERQERVQPDRVVEISPSEDPTYARR